jgi:hypothetical protein
MDNLRTLLDSLEDRKLDYVIERSKVRNDKTAYTAAGIGKTAFFAWGTEERERLNDLAQRIKREAATRALMVLQDKAEEAAKIKADGLTSNNEHIRQDAASDILDRILGRAAQRQELDVTSNGENPFMTMEAAELIALARKVVDGHSD